MRPRWIGECGIAEVSWSVNGVHLAVRAGDGGIFLGPWQAAATLNDKPLTAKGGWRETCWVSDEDMDYLELALDLSHDFRIERHFLLARSERVLFLADALIGEKPGRIACRPEIHLDAGVRFRRTPKTDAAILTQGARPLASLVPFGGDLELGPTEATVILERSATGRALFAPLWIDLDPSRLRKKPLWRRLTVAQNRENVAEDVAVAYRVQIADRQWFFYRALGETAPRTALGQHLATEFALGPFAKTGVFTKWIEVE